MTITFKLWNAKAKHRFTRGPMLVGELRVADAYEPTLDELALLLLDIERSINANGQLRAHIDMHVSDPPAGPEHTFGPSVEEDEGQR